MVKDVRYGLMAPNMKVSGSMAKHVAKVNFGIWMAIYLKVSGLMIKLTGMGSTATLMGRATQASGKMTCNTVKEKSIGLMAVNTSVTTSKEKNMAKDSTGGQTDHSTQACG